MRRRKGEVGERRREGEGEKGLNQSISLFKRDVVKFSLSL